MADKKVYIVDPHNSASYRVMFIANGFIPTDNMKAADLVCFTGGPDLDPSWYDQHQHPSCVVNTERDDYDGEKFGEACGHDKPMVGICRGAQFLNVMNGGKLYQHVNGHDRPHRLLDHLTDKEYVVTSTHHQQMIPHHSGEILATSYGISNTRVFGSALADKKIFRSTKPSKGRNHFSGDPEVVFYDRALCFQPHPEFSPAQVFDTRRYFFELLDMLL